MATSGSFNTSAFTASGGGTRYLTFSWSRASYSVENNTTTISYTLKGAGTYTGWVNTRNIKLVVNGTTVYTAAGPIKVYQGTVLKSGTVTISHNNDGTKSFSASVDSGIYDSTVDNNGSSSWALDTIPRASTIKATNGNIGSNTTITITRASSNFTHTLTWSCSGLSGTFATKTTATSVTGTISTDIYAKIPNAKTATVTVTCDTYNGSTPIGSSTCTFTATASESACKPTLSRTSIEDANTTATAVTGSKTRLIKGVSNVKVTGVKAESKNSATLKSVVFKCDSKTSSIAIATATAGTGTATISAVPSGKFTLTATDSRGYSTTITDELTIVDYAKPTLTLAKVERAEQTSDTAKVTFQGTYDSYSTIFNGLTFNVRYKPRGGSYSGWSTVATIDKNGTGAPGTGKVVASNMAFAGEVSLSLDYRKEYTIELKITDNLTSTIYTLTLAPGVPIFDWGEKDFNFNVPISFSGTVMNDFVVEQGTKTVTDATTSGNVTWYYRKWNSGIAECWATRKLEKQKVETQWVNVYHAPAPEPLDYPFTFVENPVENAVMMGNAMSGWTGSAIANSTTQTGKYMLMRPNTFTAEHVIWVHYRVIGRWK